MMILRSRVDYMQPFRVVEYSVISQNREKTLMRKTSGGDSLVPLSFSELEDEENTTNQAMLKVRYTCNTQAPDGHCSVTYV
jgi:hypothetical protein